MQPNMGIDAGICRSIRNPPKKNDRENALKLKANQGLDAACQHFKAGRNNDDVRVNKGGR